MWNNYICIHVKSRTQRPSDAPPPRVSPPLLPRLPPLPHSWDPSPSPSPPEKATEPTSEPTSEPSPKPSPEPLPPSPEAGPNIPERVCPEAGPSRPETVQALDSGPARLRIGRTYQEETSAQGGFRGGVQEGVQEAGLSYPEAGLCQLRTDFPAAKGSGVPSAPPPARGGGWPGCVPGTGRLGVQYRGFRTWVSRGAGGCRSSARCC